MNSKAVSFPLLVEVSPGELIDRACILRIKASRLKEDTARLNALSQAECMREALASILQASAEVQELAQQLDQINMSLWDAENAIRVAEHEQHFGEAFVETARRICHLNDHRSHVKREINMLLQSSVYEVKEYDR